MTKKSRFQCDATKMSWTCSNPWADKQQSYIVGKHKQQKIQWRFVELYQAGNGIFNFFVVNWLASLFDNCLVENRMVAPSSRNEIFRPRELMPERQPGNGTTEKKHLVILDPIPPKDPRCVERKGNWPYNPIVDSVGGSPVKWVVADILQYARCPPGYVMVASTSSTCKYPLTVGKDLSVRAANHVVPRSCIVFRTSSGKNPRSARNSMSMASGWPRRGMRRARLPVRTIKVTAVGPTVKASWYWATTRMVLSSKSCKDVFQAANARQTGKSGTKATCVAPRPHASSFPRRENGPSTRGQPATSWRRRNSVTNRVGNTGGSEPKDAPGQRKRVMRPSLARYPQKKTCTSRVPLSGWLPHGQGRSNYFHFIRTQAVTTKVSHEAGPTRPCCLVSSAVSQKGMDVTLVSSHAPETLASSCHDGWML